MIRSIAIIAAAIQLSQPDMPRAQAERYAKVLRQEAKEHNFDPLTGVAIVHRESRWIAGAVSEDGEDYGLAQIRARYVGACRQDADPLHAPSEACKAVKQSLLQGENNLRVMATLVTLNRELCKQKTGTARFEQWLASYEGRNYPGRDRWCKATDQTRQVLRYRQWLLAELARPQRKQADKARKSTAKRERGQATHRRGAPIGRAKPAAPRKPAARKAERPKLRSK
ncbi:MAG: hypothetical protein MUF54_06695 [Polyangiaceae bacterium]|nr:hypothetical protein [Polyangiaceae bacterium]